MIEIEIREKKDRVVPVLPEPSNMLDMLGSIKWSNAKDCPAGYSWNDEGWVITEELHMRITFNMLPFMLSQLGMYQVLFQNALALRCLNNKQADIIKVLVKYRFKNSMLFEPDEITLDKAIDDAFNVEDIPSILPLLSDKIFAYKDVWVSNDCTNDIRRKAGRIIRGRYLDDMRSFMTIDTKYKTKDVAEFSEESIYAVKCYWEDTGLTKKLRTVHSVLEAVEYLAQEGVKITQESIAIVAGISIPTASKLVDREYVKKLNTSVDEG